MNGVVAVVAVVFVDRGRDRGIGGGEGGEGG